MVYEWGGGGLKAHLKCAQTQMYVTIVLLLAKIMYMRLSWFDLKDCYNSCPGCLLCDIQGIVRRSLMVYFGVHSPNQTLQKLVILILNHMANRITTMMSMISADVLAQWQAD